MEQLADALIQGLDQQAYVAIDGDTLTREDFVESNTRRGIRRANASTIAAALGAPRLSEITYTSI
jgi:hypothetical protein